MAEVSRIVIPQCACQSADTVANLVVDCNNTVLKHMKEQFDNPESSDVVVKLRDKTFHLHKVILSQSSIFRAMLYGEQWKESQRSEIELTESTEYWSCAEDFFRYMYTGTVTLTNDNFEPILYFADKYFMSDLACLCAKYMKEQIQSKGVMTFAFHCWRVSRKLQDADVNAFAFNFIVSNMDTFLTNEHLVKACETVEWEALLVSDKMVLKKEEDLLYLGIMKCVFSMINSGTDVQTIVQFLKLVLPYLKFCHISVAQIPIFENLLESVHDSLYETVQPFVNSLLYHAYKHHALADCQRTGIAEELPRLYTDPNNGYCLPFRLSNLENLSQWTKITQYFKTPISLSSADKGKSLGWEVTLMRKIKLLQSRSVDTTKSGVSHCTTLSLKMACTSERHCRLFRAAHIVIYEQIDGDMVVRQVKEVLFDLPSQTIYLHDFLPYEVIAAKNSSYYVTASDTEKCHLAIDIVLSP